MEVGAPLSFINLILFSWLFLLFVHLLSWSYQPVCLLSNNCRCYKNEVHITVMLEELRNGEASGTVDVLKDFSKILTQGKQIKKQEASAGSQR